VSQRLPASALAVLVVLTMGAGLLAAGPPAAAYGERAFERNTVVANADLDVFRDQSVAQSFRATDTYRLLSLSLRLRNTGSVTDPMNVSVRPDLSGRPSNAVLTEAQAIGPGSISLVNVTFAQPAVLMAGARYWIVATHPGPLSDSYRWYHSNSDTYADGWAMYNLNLGGGWLNVTPRTDMYFETFGREEDANVSLDVVALSQEALWKDLVTFRVHYNNSGSLSATRVWINASLASGMTYVSDTATSSTTPYPGYTFTEVPNGIHSFDITARVDVGVPPGAALMSSVRVDYLNATGAPRGGETAQASVFVGRALDTLYLAPGTPYDLVSIPPTGGVAQQTNVTLREGTVVLDFDLEPPFAASFRAFEAAVVLFLDSRSAQAENLDVNMTLLDVHSAGETPVAYAQTRVRTDAQPGYEPFALSFPTFDRTFPADHALRLRLRNMVTSSNDAYLAMYSTSTPSRLTVRTSTFVQVRAIDLLDDLGPTTTWTGQDRLVIRANVSDPLGTGQILSARLNVTDPTGTVRVGDTPMTLAAVDPSPRPAWALYEYGLAPPLENGTHRIEVTAYGAQGTAHPLSVSADVQSPRLSLSIVPTSTNVGIGDRFTYRIYQNNTGGGTALRTWLNVSLPSQLSVVGDSDPANRTGLWTWTRTSVAPGSYRLDLDILVASGFPVVPFLLTSGTLDYVDEKGHAWPTAAASSDVAMNGPVVTVTQTPSPGAAHVGESVTFQIGLQNTGDLAGTLWLNDTLSPGLEYVSNDADTLGGVTTFSGGVVRIRFVDMPGGSIWTFHVVARIAVGTAPGTVLENRLDLNYTNANGSLMLPEESTVAVLLSSPWLTNAAIALTPSSALGGDVVRVVVTLSNVGNEAASTAWLNLTLDPNLTFRDASWPATVSGTEVRFVGTNLAIGDARIDMNVTVIPTVVDAQDLWVTGVAAYLDGLGNLMASVSFAPGSVRTSAPQFSVRVTPLTATIEAGRGMNLTISLTNAGSGTASSVWLNISLPAPLIYVSDSSDGLLTRQVYSLLSWQWSGFGPGTRTFDLALDSRPSVLTGTSEDSVFRIEFLDPNGNWRSGPEASAHMDFVAPMIELELALERVEATPGSTIAYTMTVRNAGATLAKNLWLVDVVDSRLEIVTYVAPVRGEGAPTINWTFVDVLPGQEEVILLFLRVREATPAGAVISNIVEAFYTNSEGDVIGYERSTPVTLSVPGIVVPTSILSAVGVAALAAAGLTYVVRRRGIQIEEVFLVYRDGVLIYHISRSLVADRDEDVLSGMLTAVQEFVRDAFRYGEHRQLHQLDFGDYRILIERGKTVYLAIVYSGHESPAVRRKVRTVLGRIEAAYADVLADWNGDMDKMIGARDILRENLLRPTARAKGRPA
jgi:uncharacterized repeat protein (TIGR01451 family)